MRASAFLCTGETLLQEPQRTDGGEHLVVLHEGERVERGDRYDIDVREVARCQKELLLVGLDQDQRALEAELGCADVLQVIASVRGAMNGLMAELMEHHIRYHVVDPNQAPDSERAKGAEELIYVVRPYLK